MTALPSPFAAGMPALVGRERELGLLRAMLAEALAGHGGLALVGGEAGVGKTTLAEWAIAEAAGQGALVLVGRCYDLAETPPYGPWVDLFGRYRPARDGPPLPAAFATRGTMGAVDSQAALVAKVRDWLAALAAQQPLALLLEDLHWADPASLDLMRVVARDLADLSTLLLVTYRDDALTRRHPLYALLPTLEREARAPRFDLRRFDAAGMRALVGERYALPEAGASRLVAWLMDRTAGNAFFTNQLLRALEDGGALHRSADAWGLGDLGAMGLPAPLRQVLDARLARLGEEAERLLALAAVIGQEVPLALWAIVAETDEDGLLDTIERGVEARLLEALPAGDTVRFAHTLVREALYEGTLPVRRRRLHRRAADALLANPHPDPDAVAGHLQRAGDPRAIVWLTEAGHRALRAAASRTASERFGAALTLLGDGGAPAERGWLLLYFARARFFDDPHGGIGHLREVLHLAALSGDRALAAFGRYQLGFHLTGVGEQRQGLPEMAIGMAAIESLTPEERQRSGSLSDRGIATLALRLAHVGHFKEALSLAQQAKDQGDENDANFALAEAYTAFGRVAEALACRERGYATLRQLSHWNTLGICAWFGLRRLVIPYQADHLEKREQTAAAATAAFARSEELRGGETPRLGRLPLLALEGEWAEARTLALAVEAGSRSYRPGAVSVLAEVAFAQGDRALLASLVRKMLPGGPSEEPGSIFLLTGLRLQRLAALQAIADGDLTTARDWLNARDQWMAWSGAVLGLAEGQLGWAAYHRAGGDDDTAREHAEAALAHATEPRQPLALLAAHRLLGELATDRGDHAVSADHLAHALALAEACAAPYERALTLLALAELRMATGGWEQAVTLLAEARALLEPLEARPALARADALADRLAAAPAATLPFGLTAREMEVLRLVAEGMSDAQVAERLFLSPYTVKAHLRSIYGKLGVTSRTAAARLAADRGLI